MIYRRFGKTELSMPVLTCGAMRFQQSWKDLDAHELDPQKQAVLEAAVRRAVDAGITHVETARGYGTSEVQLGLVLPSLRRDRLLVQTKIGPKDSEEEFLATFETSLKKLQLDYVDLLAVHGINTHEIIDQTLHKGTLKACRRLQAEGRARHIGFSTHGPTDVIVAAIETGEFSYVNLHWFYFDQAHWPAIVAARRRDMGTLIISPNDKGGKLYEPPDRLTQLCHPLTPMGFNDLFCLSHEEVHTISIGTSRPEDWDAHLAVLPLLGQAGQKLAPVMQRLHRELARCCGQDWADHWQEGLPPVVHVPEELPLYHIVRMVNLARAYDMVEFGKMRYNLLGSGGHWFPGQKVDKVNGDLLARALEGYRFAGRIPDMLRDAHRWFNAEDKKRLSESEA